MDGLRLFCFRSLAPNTLCGSLGVQSILVMNSCGRKMRLRVAMALQTPAHAQPLDLRDLLHLVDPAVTRNAAHAASNMGAMVKIGIVRQIVDLDPVDRVAGGRALADRRQLGAIGRDDGVAVHAHRGGRNRGKSGIFDRGVAVAAVDAQFARRAGRGCTEPAARASSPHRSSAGEPA